MTITKRQAWLLSALLASTAVPLPAHEGSHPHGHAPEGFPTFYYDPADRTVAGAVLDDPSWYDGDVLSSSDGLWYAWLDYTSGEGDDVWVGLRRDGRWGQREQTTDVRGGYARPTLTRAADGRIWLTYEHAADEEWNVFAVPLDDGRPAGAPHRVSPGAGADINHAAAADPSGGLWIVWQSDRNGQFEIQARRVTMERVEETAYLSDSPHGDWHPSTAVGTDGTVYVAWDGYNGSDYDVYLRTLRGDTWQPAITVAGSPGFEGRAQVAIDGAGRVWLAWEEGSRNWGKPYRGIDTTTVTDQIGPLHRFRRLQLAVLGDDGTVGLLRDGLPMPSAHWAEHRDPEDTRSVDPPRSEAKSARALAARGNATLTKKDIGAFYERAVLTVDETGRLWVAYRHCYTPWLGYLHRSHVEQGWGVYARCYGADGWSKLYRLDVDQGDGLQRLEVTPHGAGIALVHTTGRTDRRENERPRGLITATIRSDGSAPDEIAVRPRSSGTPEGSVGPERGRERPSRPTVQFDGREYELFFGDLHRHTDLSLCRVAIDGTIDDAYRYAIDPGRLDFLAITDHSRDIDRGQWLSLLWWRCSKEVKRHELGTDFFPFYAYERSHSETADHNVISLRRDMLRPHTYPVPEFWKELDPDTLTIPHQPIRRDTWKYQNDVLRPLVEIYQGCRDDSIEADVHRGLDQGYHLGFIASSDHMSTSGSYACVWVEEPSREAIFRALQARRTYGATDKIRLTFRAGKHWMGEAFSAAEVPPLELNVAGTAPIESVTLVVDGKAFKTVHPHEQKVELRDRLDLTGRHYIYYHLVQSDGNEAWSSPVWITVPQEQN